MDIEVVRTFLEIARTRSFVRAAERLHVTQTTVTMRIKNLEEQVGNRLFVRNRSGARLTAEGERFVPYATNLVQTWDRARQDLALPEGHRERVAAGCELTLWHPVLLDWTLNMRRRHADIAVSVTVEPAATLHSKVERGVLDMAVVYSPEYYHGLNIELLMEEKLVLVTTDPSRKLAPGLEYVRVDWGSEFLAQHDTAFPHLAQSSLFIRLGPLALNYLLSAGGSAYLRSRVVQPLIDAGRLYPVQDAPEFTYPVFLVHRSQETGSPLTESLQVLRDVAALPQSWSAAAHC